MTQSPNAHKVVHLTSVHSTFDIRIFLKQCRTLAQAGYSVVLIGQHTQDAVHDGVRIRALPSPKSRVERMLFTTFHLLKLALKEKAHVYHFHDPELIPVGIALRGLGKHVIYDVHEDVPKQVLAKQWIPPLLRPLVARLVAAFEWLASRAISRIVVVTPSIKSRFPDGKTVLVQNFPILDELVPAQEQPYDSREALVTYVGGISVERGIHEMVESLTLLPDNLNARLRLAGRFVPTSLRTSIQNTSGWERVDYLGWQSREGVGQLLGQSRIGLVVLHPTPNHLESQPIKLYEYMSAGIPVIASNFPTWRKIVEGVGCGLVVDPMDAEEIAEAIHYLLANPSEAREMGIRGQKAVRDMYNWAVEAEKLLAMYEELVR